MGAEAYDRFLEKINKDLPEDQKVKMIEGGGGLGGAVKN